MGIFDLFKKGKQDSPTLEDKSVPPAEPNQSKYEDERIEFLIIGDLEITAENHDQIMTPNSFAWIKVQKDNWSYYQVDQAEFSYSWEPPGIQMTFNGEIAFQKAKNIAEEIIDNIKATGQSTELIVLNPGKIYNF